MQRYHEKTWLTNVSNMTSSRLQNITEYYIKVLKCLMHSPGTGSDNSATVWVWDKITTNDAQNVGRGFMLSGAAFCLATPDDGLLVCISQNLARSRASYWRIIRVTRYLTLSNRCRRRQLELAKTFSQEHSHLVEKSGIVLLFACCRQLSNITFKPYILCLLWSRVFCMLFRWHICVSSDGWFSIV